MFEVNFLCRCITLELRKALRVTFSRIAGELLLSTNAKGYGGVLRPCLYVKGVQKFALALKRRRARALAELVEKPMATPGCLQGTETSVVPVDMGERIDHRTGARPVRLNLVSRITCA